MLSLLDGLIVVAYLATLAVIGVWFARRQTSLDKFFVASRHMSWLPVGLSLMAALNSGIDYLTQPSATIQYGLVLVLGTLSWLVIYRVGVARRVSVLPATAASIRSTSTSRRASTFACARLARGIFVVWRLGWMATALYVPCLAIDAVTGGAIDLTMMIVVLGMLVTLYTMLGGIQAVIWNDVMQFCVMFGGLAATVAIVISSVPGGVGEVWDGRRHGG